MRRKQTKAKKQKKKVLRLQYKTSENLRERERERERERAEDKVPKELRAWVVRRKGKERKKEKQLQWGSTREVRGKVGETLLRSRRRAGETRAYETREKERGPQKTG